MDTLYDLLGALPSDDAEGLRAAFRRAVKGAHPDIKPGDPDAALKFRQIVRASEILGDVGSARPTTICWSWPAWRVSRPQSTLLPTGSTRSPPA